MAHINTAKDDLTAHIDTAKDELTAHTDTSKDELMAHINTAKGELVANTNAAKNTVKAHIHAAKNEVIPQVTDVWHVVSPMRAKVNIMHDSVNFIRPTVRRINRTVTNTEDLLNGWYGEFKEVEDHVETRIGK